MCLEFSGLSFYKFYLWILFEIGIVFFFEENKIKRNFHFLWHQRSGGRKNIRKRKGDGIQ